MKENCKPYQIVIVLRTFRTCGALETHSANTTKSLHASQFVARSPILTRVTTTLLCLCISYKKKNQNVNNERWCFFFVSILHFVIPRSNCSERTDCKFHNVPLLIHQIVLKTNITSDKCNVFYPNTWKLTYLDDTNFLHNFVDTFHSRNFLGIGYKLRTILAHIYCNRRLQINIIGTVYQKIINTGFKSCHVKYVSLVVCRIGNDVYIDICSEIDYEF